MGRRNEVIDGAPPRFLCLHQSALENQNLLGASHKETPKNEEQHWWDQWADPHGVGPHKHQPQ